MREMGSREFQLNYQRVDEPEKVTAGKRVIGYFYPGDVPPDQGSQPRMVFDEVEPPEEPSGGPRD